MNSKIEILILTIVYCLNKVNSIYLNQSLLLFSFNYSFDSEFIDLSNQSIQAIDLSTFNGFKYLKTLYLEQNHLITLENGLFRGLSQLREIWFESNNLNLIDRNAFVGLTNLELVCLYGNPISNLFPSLVQPLCATNPKCSIKIAEKCEPLGILICI